MDGLKDWIILTVLIVAGVSLWGTLAWLTLTGRLD